MPEDSRILIILGRPFLAITRAMIDVFNKKITLRVGDDEVIFDMDQSMNKPPSKDDECYDIDDFNDIINKETQESLEGDHLDSFLLRDLEKMINKIDLENCNSMVSELVINSNIEIAIRCIESVDTAYLEEQKGEGVESEHLYLASANEIDEKKPELKDLPSHLEYAYLHGNEAFPVIVSSNLSVKEKKSLLQVLEKHKGGITWKMSDIKGISPSFCT
ncbi:hypothetical protein Tco_0160122, partial [Tanacetum coccineum]